VATESVLYEEVVKKRDRRKESVGREPSFREDLRVEAEQFPLLEAATSKRLVKTLQTEKDLVCAVVICKVWKLAMTL
jgi:hypothetical protein